MHNYTQIKSRKEEMSLSFQSNPNNHVQKLRSITAYKQLNLNKKKTIKHRSSLKMSHKTPENSRKIQNQTVPEK